MFGTYTKKYVFIYVLFYGIDQVCIGYPEIEKEKEEEKHRPFYIHPEAKVYVCTYIQRRIIVDEAWGMQNK